MGKQRNEILRRLADLEHELNEYAATAGKKTKELRISKRVRSDILRISNRPGFSLDITIDEIRTGLKRLIDNSNLLGESFEEGVTLH